MILDATAFCADFHMRGTAFQTLLGGYERAGLTLCVAESVKDEVVNQFREQCQEITIRRYSDQLLMFLLKGKRPDVFRERIGHTGKDGRPMASARPAALIRSPRPTKDPHWRSQFEKNRSRRHGSR